MSDERFVAIEDRLTSVETKVDDLGREMRELHADSKREMHTLHDDLRRHMGVLHEDTIDKIKALAPDFGPIRREFTAADDKLKDERKRR